MSYLTTFQTTYCLSFLADASVKFKEDGVHQVHQDELGVQEEEDVGWFFCEIFGPIGA